MAYQKRPNGGAPLCIGCLSRVDNGVVVCESCMVKLQQPAPPAQPDAAALRFGVAPLHWALAVHGFRGTDHDTRTGQHRPMCTCNPFNGGWHGSYAAAYGAWMEHFVDELAARAAQEESE